MKITAQIKLVPLPEHTDALRRTLEAANAACNDISRVAWDQQTFGKYDLQTLTYSRLKNDYGLSAQMVIRCLAKVGDSYKLDRQKQRSFSKHGSIAYDDRILSFQLEQQTVSIWTVDGRLKQVPFVCGERQHHLLQSRQGESDLVYRKGMFFLLVTCNVDEPTPDEVDHALGIDLGIVNLATDSDGEIQSGDQIEQRRQWYANRRAALQKAGTKSAKRRLKSLSGRQRRFQADTNHVISKRLVAKAKDTKRAIALENLTHLRTRTTVRHTQRARHHNWAFGQLRRFISYKAQLQGVAVLLVDPRNSSRTCNVCGFCDKGNRTTQERLCCVSCGHTTLADVNAACTIRDWAGVMQPMV
jgi:putative transposase